LGGAYHRPAEKADRRQGEEGAKPGVTAGTRASIELPFFEKKPAMVRGETRFFDHNFMKHSHFYLAALLEYYASYTRTRIIQGLSCRYRFDETTAIHVTSELDSAFPKVDP
jgi:hypothetical protein